MDFIICFLEFVYTAGQSRCTRQRKQPGLSNREKPGQRGIVFNIRNILFRL